MLKLEGCSPKILCVCRRHNYDVITMTSGLVISENNVDIICLLVLKTETSLNHLSWLHVMFSLENAFVFGKVEQIAD